MVWRAWYPGATVTGHTLEEWRALPHELVAFKLRDEGPKRVEHGGDAIYWDGIRLCSVNLPHPLLAAAADRLAAEGVLKFGFELPDDVWERVSAEVAADLLEE